MKSKFLLSLAAALVLPAYVLADPITSIQVEGARRIEPDTVINHMKVKEGEEYDRVAVRDSIRALYKTGFFKDVSVELVGGQLIVHVTENPMINEVKFEGNDALSLEELEKLVELKARNIYNKAKTESDVAALRQAYRIKGLFLAEVDLTVAALDENRVDLVYKIREGEKSKVREVRVVGNEAFSDRKLRGELMMQQSDWLSWFTEKDTYDREKLIYDQEQLRNFYLDNGYARVRVDSSVAELTPDRKAFIVTHTVHEGERYRVGEVKISSDFDERPMEDLEEQLEIYANDWYSRESIRNTIENLTDVVGDFGYAFVDVAPETVIDDENRKVDVHLHIAKGPRVYVNRIEIAGNTRTRDEVIRRELRFAEGDRFSTAKVRDSKKRLKGLDFFEKIEVETPQTSEDADRVNVNVKVEEKSTGAFTVGAGYSSQEQFLGTARISQRNFLGRGQNVSLSFLLSMRTLDGTFSFTEPYFLDNDRVSAGFDIYSTITDRDDIASYKQKSTGVNLRSGFRLSDHWSDSLLYRLSQEEITEVDSDASQTIREQEENSPYLQSMLSNTLQWNSVDSSVEPTRGRRHKFVTDYSGLGGDVDFVRFTTDNSYFHTLSPKHKIVGHVRGRLGVIEGLGQDVPSYERFYLGGSQSVRGFEPSGIGPHAPNGDSMGGNMFEQGNVELTFPFWGLEDKGVRGLTFLDMGYIHELDEEERNVTSGGGIRMSTGVGVNWNSPFGPLRFTIGVPILKDDEDETQLFDFAIGTFL